MPAAKYTIHAKQSHSLGNGVKDNVQVYNIPKFDGYHERQQPLVLSENIAEIEAFSRVCILNRCHAQSESDTHSHLSTEMSH